MKHLIKRSRRLTAFLLVLSLVCTMSPLLSYAEEADETLMIPAWEEAESALDESVYTALSEAASEAAAPEIGAEELVIAAQEGRENEITWPGGSSSGTTHYNTTKQLTEQDILDMNDGTALIVYTEEGYVTTIVGRYFDRPVTDYNDAINAIQGVASLLGLNAGAEFFAVYGETDNRGYTYYTYEQRSGSLTVAYATLKIVLDPEGYPCVLSSSMIPNRGYNPDRPSISTEEAAAVVAARYPDTSLTFYLDSTDELAVAYEGQTVNCLVIYTDNPNQSISFDMPYLAHFVAFEGTYLNCVPTSSLTRTSMDLWHTEDYFDGLEQQEPLHVRTTLANGETRDLTVPVAYNPADGKYYLADTTRKILFADYPSFRFDNELAFHTSDTPDDWPVRWMLAMDSLTKIYDFYADMRIYSVDGFGIPILVTTGLCDPDGTPQDNACYYGINDGWACFGISEINEYAAALDVMGHEYTHGVTTNSMQGMIYENYPGAINESYCDIMGNLIEMSYRETVDEEWLLGESSGHVVRSMSEPTLYEQPQYAGDVYYLPEATNPGTGNDHGGVHINSSLTNRIAYELYAAGMSYIDEVNLWFTSIEILTPRANYNDLCAVLMASADILGLEGWRDKIYDIFQASGLIGNIKTNALTATREGYARITIPVIDEYASSDTMLAMADANGHILYKSFPDEDGAASILVPAGTYAVVFEWQEADGAWMDYIYDGTAWQDVTQGGLVLLQLNADDSILCAPFTGLYPADVYTGQSGNDDGPTETEPAPPETQPAPPETQPAPPETEPAETEPAETEPAPFDATTLPLALYNNGLITMNYPAGWTIVDHSDHLTGNANVVCFDPANPSMVFFFYQMLGGTMKSQAAYDYWQSTLYAFLYRYAPVLTNPTAGGMLGIWEQSIQYQLDLDGFASFPYLSNIAVISDEYVGSYDNLGDEYIAIASATGVDGKEVLVRLDSCIDTSDVLYMGNVDVGFINFYGTNGLAVPMDVDVSYATLLMNCLTSIRLN